jgi:hypothetical protein
MGMGAMGMSSPIYQSLLNEYTKQAQNPYAAASGSIEQASRDVNTQQQQIMAQSGRGPGQQYASAMAQAQVPIYGQQQMTAQRNAGLAGMGNVAGAYENRMNTMLSLAGQSLGSAGNNYANLTQSGAQNRQNYQSPWGQAFGQAGALVGQGMMGMGGEKTNTSGYGNFIAPTGSSASVPTTSSLFPRQYLYGQTPNAARPWGG